MDPRMILVMTVLVALPGCTDPPPSGEPLTAEEGPSHETPQGRSLKVTVPWHNDLSHNTLAVRGDYPLTGNRYMIFEAHGEVDVDATSSWTCPSSAPCDFRFILLTHTEGAGKVLASATGPSPLTLHWNGTDPGSLALLMMYGDDEDAALRAIGNFHLTVRQ